MIAPPIHHLHMHVALRAARKAFKEIRHQFSLQIAYQRHIHLIIHRISRPPAEVDSSDRQRLIHRHHKIPGTHDALLIAQRNPECLTQRDAYILHRVVLVDIEIALAHQRQIEPAMPRKQLQHVIEKPYPRLDRVHALPIDHQRQRDLRLRRIALDCPSPHRIFARAHAHSPFNFARCTMATTTVAVISPIQTPSSTGCPFNSTGPPLIAPADAHNTTTLFRCGLKGSSLPVLSS